MSEPDIRFVVPGLPRSKERARGRIVTTKDNRQFVATYTPSKTRNEEAVIRDMAEQAMNGRAPLQGALDLRISIFLPVPHSWSARKQAQALAGIVRPTVRPDWDNCAKLTDACNGICWRDDSQIVGAHVWKFYSQRPRVAIEVREILQPVVSKAPANNAVSQAEMPLLTEGKQA